MAEYVGKLLESLSRAEKLCSVISDFIGGASYDVREIKSSVFELNRVFNEISIYVYALEKYPVEIRKGISDFFGEKAKFLSFAYTLIMGLEKTSDIRNWLQLLFLAKGLDINKLCALLKVFKNVISPK